MSILTTYANKLPTAAIAGTPADLRPKDVISRRQGEASANVAFGVLMMTHATADNDAVLPSTGAITTDKFAGVVLHEHKDVSALTSPDAYVPGEMMALMRKGVINVFVEDAVTPASVVHVRLATSGSFLTLGAFRATVDPSTASKTATVTGMRFLTTAGISGIAQLEISDNVTFTQDS